MALQRLLPVRPQVLAAAAAAAAARCSATRSAACRFYSSASDVVSPLAFDLHEPAKPKFDSKTSPILFLHGLFGSKKNNRAMSKYVLLKEHKVAAITRLP
jgi:hypothetical protein